MKTHTYIYKLHAISAAKGEKKNRVRERRNKRIKKNEDEVLVFFKCLVKNLTYF